MSKKFLKLFGLMAVLLLAAGVAWAAVTYVQPLAKTVTVNVTDLADYRLDQPNSSTLLANNSLRLPYYVFNGTGDFTGAQWGAFNLGTDPGQAMALHLTTATELSLKPRMESQYSAAIFNSDYRNPIRSFSLIANGTGKVNIYGGQGNAPTAGLAVNIGGNGALGSTNYLENTYAGGLYVEGGTVGLAHSNAAGYGPVLVAEGAKLDVIVAQTVNLGRMSPNNIALTTQPLVLAYDVTKNANILGDGSSVNSTINVGNVGGNNQTLEVYSGIRQAGYASGEAAVSLFLSDRNAGAINNWDRTDSITLENHVDAITGNMTWFDIRQGQPTGYTDWYASGDLQATQAIYRLDGPQISWWYNASPTSHRPGKAVRLVKTGVGLLDIKAADDEKQAAIWNNTHLGGTDLQGGLIFVDGAQGAVANDKFKGSLGRTWAWGTHFNWSGYNGSRMPGSAVPSRNIANLSDGAPRHNFLKMAADTGLILNRDQFFSYFNSASGSVFTSFEYAILSTNYRPQISVWLGGEDSVFAGKMGPQYTTSQLRQSSFDLVLESRHRGQKSALAFTGFAGLSREWDAVKYLNFPARANGVQNPAQAFLHLDYPENEITGLTKIANGVLAVAGARSIADKGNGSLTIAMPAFLKAETATGFATYPLEAPAVLGLNYSNRVYFPYSFLNTPNEAIPSHVVGDSYLENDRAVFLMKGAGTVVINNPTTVNDYGSLAAVNGTTSQYTNIALNGFNQTLRTPTQPMNPFATWSATNYNYSGNANIVINPRAVIEAPSITGLIETGTGTIQVYPDIMNVEAPIIWRDIFTYPVWTGTVALGVNEGDTYTFGGTHRAPTNLTISRGTLHLGDYPLGNDNFANTMIRSSATLSLGENVNDFANRMNVTFDDDSRIRIVVRDTDLMENERGDKDVLMAPAIFEAQLIEFGPLGTGDANKDKRIVIEVDAKTSGLDVIPAGTWIKAVGATVGNHWNNMHYSGSGTDRDYWKVRVALPGYADQPLDDSDVKVHLNEDTHEILLEFLKDLHPTPDPVLPVDANLAKAAPGNVTTAIPGEDVELFYTIGADYIPGEIEIAGLPAGWTAEAIVGNLNGYNYVVRGNMGTLDMVSFYLFGINQSTLKEFKSTQFSVNATTPTVDNLVGSVTPDVTQPAAGTSVLFTVGNWIFTPAGGTAQTLAWDAAGLTYGLLGGQAVVVNGAGTYESFPADLITDNTLLVNVNAAAVTGTTVIITVNAMYNGVAGTARSTVTVNNGTTPSGDSSSGGCDAGFAGLALLLAAPLFLRKKD